MSTIRILTWGVVLLVCTGVASNAPGLTINFNMAGNSHASNMVTYPVPYPGTYFEGQYMTDYPATGSIPAGSVIDASGAVVPGVSASEKVGNANGNDTAGAQTNPAYGNGISRSLFWHGDTMEVTIHGLSSDTRYAIGIVADALNRSPERTMDVVVNGATMADDLGEQSMISNPQFFAGTTDASGNLNVVLDDISNGSAGWKALVIDTDLSMIPVELSVDVTSGMTWIKSSSTSPVLQQVKGYSITSASASLAPGNWNSFQEQGVADQGDGGGNTDPSDGIGWEQLGAGSTSAVAEFNLWSNSLFGSGNGFEIPLGQLFTGGANEAMQDLVLELAIEDGSFLRFPATYFVGDSVDGDYNSDGAVNAADYVLWRKSLGQTGPNLPADGDGSLEVDAGDYSYWRQRFGNTSSAPGLGSFAPAVPEPSSLLLVGLLTAGACTATRRQRCGSRAERKDALMAMPRRSTIASLVGVFLLACLPAYAAYEIDRDYRLGDSDNDAGTPAAGMAVGQTTSSGDTFDDSGIVGNGSLVDMTPSGAPVYADTSGRPLASGPLNLGVQFNGSNFLSGHRLGRPSSSYSSNTQEGPFDYSGIGNRGMQFWVLPIQEDEQNYSAQSVVADTNQHAVRISDSGTWVMRYAEIDYDSGIAVDFGNWNHVMLARPHSDIGSILWVNGVAIARATGGYTGGDDSPLVLGANTGDSPGTTEFFTGTIDDLEMFVNGVTNDTMTDWGTFEFVTDNHFAADALAGYVPGDATGDGFVMGDGSGGAGDDVAVFIAHWRHEHLVHDLPAGDINSPGNGDFNFDGRTDLLDWHVLISNHVDAGSLDLAALVGGAEVPEPATIVVLLTLGGIAIGITRRRPMRSGRWVMGIAAAVVLFVVQPSEATIINFNFGPAAAGASVPGGLLGGTVNDVPLAGSNSILDSTGAATPVAVTATGWNGSNPNDGNGKFSNAAATYTNAVARSLFWGGSSPRVTISGLAPETFYAVGLVSASNGATTHDWSLNGVLVADDLPEAAAQSEVLYFNGLTDLSGSLEVRTTNHQSGQALIQALVIDSTPLPQALLYIDRDSRNITFSTLSTISASAYEITSATGALDPTQWKSIAENYDMDSGSLDTEAKWVEFTDPDDRDNLAEGRIGPAFDFVNAEVPLGPAWIRNPFQEESMTILLPNGETETVPIFWEGDPVSLADLDANGSVNLEDWNSFFKPNFNADTSGLATDVLRWKQGDLNRDGIVDLRDATLFADAYDDVNGEGAFAFATNVPEPSTWCLLAWFVCSCVIRIRWR